jgi:stalled ribosome rescue protein Dom34
MTSKNKKQYGIWMDTHVARIAGRKDIDSGEFVMLGVVSKPTADNNHGDAGNHHEKTTTQKFFKDIAAKMPNIDEIHITGTGQAQEQFIKFLAESPQYKNVVSSESTSNKMGDEQLLTLVTNYFN